jgi:hypothetical protein
MTLAMMPVLGHSGVGLAVSVGAEVVLAAVYLVAGVAVVAALFPTLGVDLEVLLIGQPLRQQNLT